MTSSIISYKKAVGKFFASNPKEFDKRITYDPSKNPPINMITTVGAKAVKEPDTNIVDISNQTWDFYNTFPMEFYQDMNLNFHPNPTKITSKANTVLENDFTYNLENQRRKENVNKNPFDFGALTSTQILFIVAGLFSLLYLYYRK